MAEADITATTSGGDRNWSSAATWVGGVKPATDQHAIIPSGASVTLDGNEEIASLVVNTGGTITGNASYSLTINSEGNASFGEHFQAVQITGAIGTNLNLILTYSGTSEYNTGSTSGRVHNLTISSDQVFWENGVSLAGDLVVDAGKIFRAYNKTKALTVDGDVTCNGTINCTGIDPVAIGEQAVSFGSLTIASGGTYNATSGTTTITGEGDGSSGTNGFAWYNDNATFTHNKGKVVIDTAGNNHTLVAENTFYDLEINQTSSVYEMKLRPSNNGGTANKILNNFTLTSGIFEKNNASDTLDIFGLTNISANGKFMEDANENTNTITHHGLVTNSGTYKINDGTTVKMNGGIRNLGTITVA